MRVKRILPRGWHPEGKVKGRNRRGADGTKPAEEVGTEEQDVLAVLGDGMDARAPGSPWRLISCDPTARAEPGKGLHTQPEGSEWLLNLSFVTSRFMSWGKFLNVSLL